MIDWEKKWKTGQTKWHKKTVNKHLMSHMPLLNLQEKDRVFVPLCGKSVDMIYLLESGYKVIGVELSELAVIDFFEEHNIQHNIKKIQHFKAYCSDDITIYCGSVFNVRAGLIAGIKAVYDRAALVALNDQLRVQYATLFDSIIPINATILLLSFNYPQEQMQGPPFAVSHEEITALFNHFDVKQLDSMNDIDSAPDLKQLGLTFFNKESYLLTKNNTKKAIRNGITG